MADLSWNKHKRMCLYTRTVLNTVSIKTMAAAMLENYP